MRKRLLRALVVLAAAAGLTLAVGGVAYANTSEIFIGNWANSTHPQCVGVILDQDGQYNVQVGLSNGTNLGFDANLCSPGGSGLTGTRELGWTHAGGYFIGSGACELEYTWDGVSGHAAVFQREVCAGTGPGKMRFIDSASKYILFRSK